MHHRLVVFGMDHDPICLKSRHRIMQIMNDDYLDLSIRFCKIKYLNYQLVITVKS